MMAKMRQLANAPHNDVLWRIQVTIFIVPFGCIFFSPHFSCVWQWEWLGVFVCVSVSAQILTGPIHLSRMMKSAQHMLYYLSVSRIGLKCVFPPKTPSKARSERVIKLERYFFDNFGFTLKIEIDLPGFFLTTYYGSYFVVVGCRVFVLFVLFYIVVVKDLHLKMQQKLLLSSRCVLL